MNIKQFHITYIAIIYTIKLIVFSLFFLWLKDSYYLVKNSGVIEILKNFSELNKYSESLQNLSIIWLWSVFYLLVKIGFLVLISFIFRHFPTRLKWIKKWDDNQEISVLLGKKLAYHLRFNTNISFQNFILLKSFANSEKNMLKIQSQNKIKKYLFLKYDSEFKNDLN